MTMSDKNSADALEEHGRSFLGRLKGPLRSRTEYSRSGMRRWIKLYAVSGGETIVEVTQPVAHVAKLRVNTKRCAIEFGGYGYNADVEIAAALKHYGNFDFEIYAL